MRLPDWATRLDAYIAAALSMPFSYDPAMGLDCCRFTWGAIHAQTGNTIGQQFVGTYRSKRESLVAMKNYCGRASLLWSIVKLMDENKFDRRRGPFFAQRGDVLLVPNGPGGDFLGIMDLNGRDVLSVGEHGIKRVPVSKFCRAWRID